MTTLELHNGCRLFPKPVGRFTTVSLPDRTNESACCYYGSMLMSALPMCCRESRIVEERLSLRARGHCQTPYSYIRIYNMERRCTYCYATQAMNTDDQHLGQDDLIGRILRNRNECCWTHDFPSRPRRFGASLYVGPKLAGLSRTHPQLPLTWLTPRKVGSGE